jgi:hypothetical protein
MHFKTSFSVIRLTLISLLALQLISASSAPMIDSPQSGEQLKGVVRITGSTQIEGFETGEVSYAYESDLGSWFLIRNNDQPVVKDVLATWDTTTIADGIYRLRVKVLLKGGKSQESIISGLKVQNYSPVERPTSNIAAIISTSTPSSGTSLVFATPIRLPENPATIHMADIWFRMVEGIAVVLALLGLLGLYIGIRRVFRGN